MAGCRTGLDVSSHTAWPWHSAVAQALPVVPLDAPEPLAQVHVDERGKLLVIGRNGRVWQGAEAGWRPLGEGLDPASPLASGHGRSVGRTLDSGLWLMALAVTPLSG